MFRDNAERLRAALEAFGREGPEAILDDVDPDVEWITDRAGLGRVVYRGHEGIVRWYTDLSELDQRVRG